MNFLQRFLSFFFPSVDSIVADFEAKAAKLDALSARKTAERNRLNVEVEYLLGVAASARAESNRAFRVAGKIRSLIESD